MDELKQINIDAIHKKLRTIPKYGDTIRCDDLFDAISTAKARDKRIINDYDTDHVVLKITQVGKRRISCRHFTHEGLIKYIHSGHILNYEAVCEFYGIKPRDFELEQFLSYFMDGVAKTKVVLKWLFGKRKQIKTLKEYIHIDALGKWLMTYDVPTYRKNKVLSYLNYDVDDIDNMYEVCIDDSCDVYEDIE